jgi:hypothetical protein
VTPAECSRAQAYKSDSLDELEFRYLLAGSSGRRRTKNEAIGHAGFGTLADLCRAGMLRDDVTAAAFVQARKESVCEPCVLNRLRRGCHPLLRPQQLRVLGRVHMDLCDLPHGYFGTVTDEATRFCTVFLVQRKSDTEAAVRHFLAWSETQTGQRVQKVRHDRGGEYRCTERDGGKGPPAENKAGCNRTDTPHSKATQRKAKPNKKPQTHTQGERQA